MHRSTTTLLAGISRRYPIPQCGSLQINNKNVDVAAFQIHQQARHISLYSLAVQRRLHRKKGLVSRDDPNEDPNARGWVFPRERLGRHYDLNWTINGYKVTPSNEAFRNLHMRGLVMHANGATDANKALHVKISEADDSFGMYFGDKPPSFVKSPSVISLESYKSLMKAMKEYLSDVEQLFVHDGAVGSHPSCECKVRVIADNAVSALYLHHMLPRVPLGDVNQYKHQLTVYVAAGFQTEDSKAYGIKENAYIVVDVARGIVVVVGTPSTQAVRSAIASVASSRILVDHRAVPLYCDLVGGDTKPVLVFSPDNLFLKKGLSLDVRATHNVAWGEQGLFRFFDGATFPTANQAKKRGSRSTVRLATNGTLEPHPSSLVFVVNDSTRTLSALTKLTPEQAKLYLAAGPTGQSQGFKPFLTDFFVADPKPALDKLSSLIQSNNAGLFIINTNASGKEMSNSDLEQTIKSIAGGKPLKSEALPNKFEQSLKDYVSATFSGLLA